MNALLVSLLRRKGIYLMLGLAISCDTFREDFIEDENQLTFSQTEFYILPASSAVIDLKALIEKSFINASVNLTIGENPIKGTLTQMDAFIWKYTPNDDFIEGKDQFTISTVLDDGRSLRSKPMMIYMKSSEAEFPCGIFAVEDNVRMDPANSDVLHVLKNDRICNVDESMDIRVHLAPKFGEAVVVGDSIIYTPGPLFSRHDELVYSVSTLNGEKFSLGLISFNKPKFEILEIPVGLTKIFFVDEMIGFIAGAKSIRKTVDGGRHWIQLTHPQYENKTVSFDDIYFLNKDHWLAAFSEWPCKDSVYVPDGNMGGAYVCPWKYMETKNAGVSWDILDLSTVVLPTFNPPFQNVANLPYTILLQGFSPAGDLGIAISGTDPSGWPAQQVLTISVSTDRGTTWADLVQHPTGHPWGISVPSSNVAYIICWGKIIKYSL